MKHEKIREIRQALQTSLETSFEHETPFAGYTRECLDEVVKLHVELEMIAAALAGAAMNGRLPVVQAGIESVLERIKKANMGWRRPEAYAGLTEGK